MENSDITTLRLQANCVLCEFTLNASSYITITNVYKPFYNKRVIYAPSKNDRELHFS
ncbi:hypothetical protein VCRA2117O37_240007 [Vibrio crassostreae]|nr:hypothetical protein VCRA2117O37_240007 [Vibrio crassostreae]